MLIAEVLTLENIYALVAIAYVSENSDNPYFAFGKYIKYCLMLNTKGSITVKELQSTVENEFGIRLPMHILGVCLENLKQEKYLIEDHHAITRIGNFDTDAFQQKRNEYKQIEDRLIDNLLDYVHQFDVDWEKEHARSLLLKVLDGDGMAYDVVITRREKDGDPSEDSLAVDCDIDASADNQDQDNMPTFSEENYVGRYIDSLMNTESIYRTYLERICEGLMICAGAYQLSSTNGQLRIPQIKNTMFFFDTRLLLRAVGCAGVAAVEATCELIELIQAGGGLVRYYPHTLTEMEKAFDSAIRSMEQRIPVKDHEMKAFCSLHRSLTVIRAKKANLRQELSNKGIQLIPLEEYPEQDRINFGFDEKVLQQYMHNELSWESQTIDNDALSIWHTHMRRRNNYRDYCGTQDNLCVFVTSNSLLVRVVQQYGQKHPTYPGISGWRPNRLPVITDVRLTCRLWSPAEQGKKLSMLHLSANVVAAQRPTPAYMNRVRELALAVKQTVPQYSDLCLSEFFSDQVAERLFERSNGSESMLTVETLAATMDELVQMRTYDQDEQIRDITGQLYETKAEKNNQTQLIIDGAIEQYSLSLGLLKIPLLTCLNINNVASILITVVSVVIGIATQDLATTAVSIAIAVSVKIAEIWSGSNTLKAWLLKRVYPLVTDMFSTNIRNSLRAAERPYADTIIENTLENTKLLSICRQFVRQNSDISI